MNTTVSITDFRKNIFQLTEQLVATNGELIVEKDNKSLLRVTPYRSSAKERAEKALKLLKQLEGTWKDKPYDDSFFRGKKEKDYFKQL